MTFRRMIVAGLLVASSGSTLADSGARHVDIGELQRIGQEGRSTGHRVSSSSEVNTASGLGLGELQQRGQEGRGEPRAGPPAQDSTPAYVDLGEAQRRGEEGRGEPAPESRSRHDVAMRD